MRSEEESLLELLMLGVHWLSYGDDAHDLPATKRTVLTALADIRREEPAMKPAADRLRGILATLWIIPQGRDWPRTRASLTWTGCSAGSPPPATTARRSQASRPGAASSPPSPLEEAREAIARAIALAAWLEGASLTALGAYTVGVDRFLAEEHPSNAWREDVVFAARPRVECQLNVVEAELMNRAQRAAFAAAPKKAVIVPACLSYHPRPRCRVRELVRLGAEHGFEVLLVPHESSVFAGEAGRRLLDDGVGIVGVTCIPNLLAGGGKALRLGLPPQCVLLDHCGCRKHWHDQGISTDIDEAQFRRVLAID